MIYIAVTRRRRKPTLVRGLGAVNEARGWPRVGHQDQRTIQEVRPVHTMQKENRSIYLIAQPCGRPACKQPPLISPQFLIWRGSRSVTSARLRRSPRIEI